MRNASRIGAAGHRAAGVAVGDPIPTARKPAYSAASADLRRFHRFRRIPSRSREVGQLQIRTAYVVASVAVMPRHLAIVGTVCRIGWCLVGGMFETAHGGPRSFLMYGGRGRSRITAEPRSRA